MLKRLDAATVEAAERVPPVLSNQGFLYLWLAQIISQTAQNAVLYALLLLILYLTESATSTSALVLVFITPTVIFGIFSGTLVDRWSKRRLLILTNAGRAAAAVAFFFTQDHLWGLYGVTVLFASLFSMGFTIAQVMGLIFLAPLLLKTVGAGPLFITAAGAFVAASLLARFLPFIGGHGEEETVGTFPGPAELKGAVSEFIKALGVLRSDPLSYLAMAHITTSSTLVLIFAVMVPRYMQAILDRQPEDAVAVFAPVVVGALIGLRSVPWFAARLGNTKTVALGLFGLAVCLIAFGFVELIAEGDQ